MVKALVKNSWVLTISLLFFYQSYAQSAADQKISITLQGSLISALGEINQLEGITLSYNSRKIKDRTIKKMEFKDTPVSEVLASVLGPEYKVEFDGEYAIIQPAPKTMMKKKKPKKKPVFKEVQGNAPEDGGLQEDVRPDDVPMISLSDSQETTSQESEPVQKKKKDRRKVASNSDSMDSTNRHHLFQISLLPGIGTSAPSSEQVSVNYSFNLLSGRHRSLHGAEIGWIYNRQETFARGFQWGGIGNYVGGEFRGLQFAGLLNLVNGDINGWQFSGFLNLGSGKLRGVQSAGLLNIAAGNSIGTQLAFGGNFQKGNLTGGQAAMAGNFNKGNLAGVQLTMGANVVSDSLKGIQMGGLYNSADYTRGAQFSLGANVAKEKARGFQMGAFNYASRLSGVQLGFINVVDSLEKGATIGLINIVKNGKTDFGLDHNDIDHVRLSFRTGTNRFYNIYVAGFRLLESNSDANDNDHLLINYGLGFGTEKSLKKNFFLNLELISTLLYNTEDSYQHFNWLNRLHANIGFRATKWLAFSGGPVLNVFATDQFNEETRETSELGNKKGFFENQTSSTLVKAWVGYSFSVNF